MARDFENVRLVPITLADGRRALKIVDTDQEPPARRQHFFLNPAEPALERLLLHVRAAFERRGAQVPRYIVGLSKHMLEGWFVSFRERDGARRLAERFIPEWMAEAGDADALGRELGEWLACRWAPERWTNRIGRRDRIRSAMAPAPPPPFRSRVHEQGKRHPVPYPHLARPAVCWHENEVRGTR